MGASSGESPVPDPRYVAARRVLLDALLALAPHGRAVIVAGAQAIYLRTGAADLAVAPYTTDGDLTLDPALLGVEPELAAAMAKAQFVPMVKEGHIEPGTWVATTQVEGQVFDVPVDLIVPESVAGAGRRGARLGIHGNSAARRAFGLEACLVDHSTMTIESLEVADRRFAQAEVAGFAALLVAKAHKLHDRATSGKPGRQSDKDAADVLRIMQTSSPTDVGLSLAALSGHAVAGPASSSAVRILEELFGHRGRPGVSMAARAMRLALPEERVQAICVTYISSLLSAVRGVT